MFRFVLPALLLTSCAPPAAQSDALQQDMIANPRKYVPLRAAPSPEFGAPGSPGTEPLDPFAAAPASIPAPAPTRQGSRPPNAEQTTALLPIYTQAAARDMRDPDSVRFRDLKLGRNAEGRDTLCGEMNAKNGYGAYVGFDPFYAVMFSTPDLKRTLAVVFLASRVGVRYVLDRCR